MRILVTGGLGFIGSALVRHFFEKGYEVTILTRNTEKAFRVRDIADGVTFAVKSICSINEKDVDGYDYVFHCASTVDNYNILDAPYADAEVNVIGTTALLEAIRKSKVRPTLVYTSSFFVNGNPEALPVTEHMKENPLGTYGATKLAAEHCIKAYARVFGIKAKIARLSNVFGIGEQVHNNKKAAFNRMVWLAVSDQAIKLYDNGRVKRDYIYIDDVVSALEAIAYQGEECTDKLYCVGRGEGVALRTMVDMILRHTRPFGRVEIVEPPKFHKDVGIGDFWYDISDTRALGWAPEVCIEEGIRRVAERYLIEVLHDK